MQKTPSKSGAVTSIRFTLAERAAVAKLMRRQGHKTRSDAIKAAIAQAVASGREAA